MVEHLKCEYDINNPANRDLRRDLKYHSDQCEILTSLAKQRDEQGPPEAWTSHARNPWMRNAWAACKAWESASSGLYGRLEDAQPLVQELTKLQVILEIWAKIDLAPLPMRPIPERVSTSEQISISTQAVSPSQMLTVRLMYDTGARPRDRASETPYLTDDLRRLFHSSEDRTGVWRLDTEVQELPRDERMPPVLARPREVPAQVKAPASRRAPTPWRSSTPMEPPMVTLRERTGLYTSMEDHEDQTLNEGFKSMSILDEARDTSSLNIRADGLRRPNSRSYTDMPKRTNSRRTIPEKPEEPKQFSAALDQVLDCLENKTYKAGMKAAGSRSASWSSSRASSVNSKRSTRSR